MERIIWQLTMMLVFVGCVAADGAAITLETVRQRGVLNCGVMTGMTGLSNTDETGTWSGINIGFCRALAAAVLGEAERVTFVVMTETNRFTALQAGEVDVLFTDKPWSFTVDTALGVHAAGILFYDGLAFLSAQKPGPTSALELDGVSLCFTAKEQTAGTIARFFADHDLKYRPVISEDAAQLAEQLASGSCRAAAGSRYELYRLRQRVLQDRQERYTVLPEVISRKPLGPFVRHGDDGWFDIVRWTLFALILAEEYGIGFDNVDMVAAGRESAISLLGLGGAKARGLGLPQDWVYQLIKQVGNYGELYERTLGQGSELDMERGINNLWNRGGLHYAPAVD